VHADVGTQSDPYAIVTSGGYSFTSAVVNNNENPVWPTDQVFDFPLANLQVQHLELSLWDSDYLKSDDFLGETVINDLVGLIGQAERDPDGLVWLDLTGVAQGKVCLRVCFFYLREASLNFAPSEISMVEASIPNPHALVTMMIHRAVGLPTTIRQVQTRPALKVTMMANQAVRQTQQSAMFLPLSEEAQKKLHISGFDVDSPCWNTTLHWVVPESWDQSTSWRLQVMHLGVFVVATATLGWNDIDDQAEQVRFVNLALQTKDSAPNRPGEVGLYMKLFLRPLSRHPP